MVVTRLGQRHRRWSSLVTTMASVLCLLWTCLPGGNPFSTLFGPLCDRTRPEKLMLAGLCTARAYSCLGEFMRKCAIIYKTYQLAIISPQHTISTGCQEEVPVVSRNICRLHASNSGLSTACQQQWNCKCRDKCITINPVCYLLIISHHKGDWVSVYVRFL